MKAGYIFLFVVAIFLTAIIGETCMRQADVEPIDIAPKPAKDTRQVDTGKITIVITAMDRRSGYTWVEGSVKNETNRTVRFVRIRVVWYDKSGEVVDTGWTYAVGSEFLRVGESSMYRSSTRHPEAVEVGVGLISYD